MIRVGERGSGNWRKATWDEALDRIAAAMRAAGPASVGFWQGHGNAANDSDTASVTVQGADLAVVKTVDDPAPNEGGTVVFTVALSNAGGPVHSFDTVRA